MVLGSPRGFCGKRILVFGTCHMPFNIPEPAVLQPVEAYRALSRCPELHLV